jgi:hypothetical protein
VLCLIGLIGGGSIPLLIISFGALLIFIALWALTYSINLSIIKKKERHMKTKETITKKKTVAASSLANITLVIGANMWSGATLSG